MHPLLAALAFFFVWAAVDILLLVALYKIRGPAKEDYEDAADTSF